MSQHTPIQQDSFIKPYANTQQLQRQIPKPNPTLIRTTSSQNFIKPTPAPQSREEFVHPNLVTQPNKKVNPEIDKYFAVPESPAVPPMIIHSITEHAGSQMTPRQNIQRPLPPRQPSAPLQPAPRPQHRIINPFVKPDPKLDGNIVDLSEQ